MQKRNKKDQGWNLRRSNMFSQAKRKELASLRTAFLFYAFFEHLTLDYGFLGRF
jgi:hypothetical protein